MSEPSTERGAVTWFASEEDGGPDCGLLLGLGDGASLYVGEMPNSTLEEHDIDIKATGDGWWLVLYERKDTTIIGRIACEGYQAQDLIDKLGAVIRGPPNPTSSGRG